MVPHKAARGHCDKLSLLSRKASRASVPGKAGPTKPILATSESAPQPPRPSRLPDRWLGTAMVVLAALCLMGLFSTEIADTDFWWHLKTGEYVVQKRALPAPDPFSYTSDLGKPAYPGEERVRRFNLTHEWLAQAVWYLVYRAAGFPAVVLFKAA